MTEPVRVARPEDAAAVAAIYEPIVRDTVISFELEPPDAVEMESRIVTVLEKYPWLVYDDDENGITGYAYASEHRARSAYRWSVDVSAYVTDGARGRGVGRALYEKLLDLVTEQGFVNAYAGITLPNDASVGFHESLGFETISIYRGVGFKAGKWHDVGWWGKRLRAVAPAVPEEPQPFRHR